MYQRNSSGPRFPKRESRARTSTRNPPNNWISSLRSFSDPNCQENTRYSHLVKSYTTLATSDIGIHWRSPQTYSEGGFWNTGKSQKGVSPLNRIPGGASVNVTNTGISWRSTQTYSENGFTNVGKSQKGVSPLNRIPGGASVNVTDTEISWRSTQTYSENGFTNVGKSQKGVSPLNRIPDGASVNVMSHKVEPVRSPAPVRDAVFGTTDVKRNIQPSTSGNTTELRIEQAARIALPSSPSDEDVSGKTRVITPEQVSGMTRVITPEQVSGTTRVITPEQVSGETRVITPEQVSAKKQHSNTAAVVKPSCSQPSGESATSDLEARRQMAIKMILKLRQQEMQDSEEETCSDSDSSGWETDTDSCSATSSATSIADTVNASSYPDEDARLTAVLRARLAAGHVPQARKSQNSVSLDEKLHAIRYKIQPRAFNPWFDEDMVDYDNNVLGLLRPPARPRAPYEGDVIATLVPLMSGLSLKHALNTDSHGGGDEEHMTQAKGRKRQHDDVPEESDNKRSRTHMSASNERISAVTYGKRKADENSDTLHAAKRARN